MGSHILGEYIRKWLSRSSSKTLQRFFKSPEIFDAISKYPQITSEYFPFWRTKSNEIFRLLQFVAIYREPLLFLARFSKVHSRAQASLKKSNRGFSSHSDLECFRYTQAGSDVEEPIGRKCICRRSSFPAQWRKTYHYVTGRKGCWNVDVRSNQPFADNHNECSVWYHLR